MLLAKKEIPVPVTFTFGLSGIVGKVEPRKVSVRLHGEDVGRLVERPVERGILMRG